MVPPTPLSCRRISDIIRTILYWRPTKEIVINLMFHPMLDQNTQNI